jgi:antitoxin (DNA-binding transcriptional repressor) of toxin-antitoxin stability system
VVRIEACGFTFQEQEVGDEIGRMGAYNPRIPLPREGRKRAITVMSSITIQEAQAQLSDLIHRLTPGDELVITENNQPVAKLARTELARTEVRKLWPCKAGSAEGKIHIAPDFDEPLEEFREYME